MPAFLAIPVGYWIAGLLIGAVGVTAYAVGEAAEDIGEAADPIARATRETTKLVAVSGALVGSYLVYKAVLKK